MKYLYLKMFSLIKIDALDVFVLALINNYFLMTYAFLYSWVRPGVAPVGINILYIF